MIDRVALVQEPRNAQRGSVALPHGAGSVEFDHVRFRYVDDVPLIEDMNLKVVPGQRIALVGPTGCGKTSLARDFAVSVYGAGNGLPFYMKPTNKWWDM